MLAPWKKSCDQPRQHIKKQRYYFDNKDPSSLSCGFSSSHVWVWELDHKQSWAPNDWCFWTVVFEKTLESPLDCKEIQPVHPKGNPSWIFIGRTDAEALILWPPDAKNWLIGKDPYAGKDWRLRRRVQQRMRCLYLKLFHSETGFHVLDRTLVLEVQTIQSSKGPRQSEAFICSLTLVSIQKKSQT